MMTDYEKIYDFQNLYKAHTVARRSKRNTREVIEFEMNLGENLTALSDSLKNGTYKMLEYYNFAIYDPKYRVIHALHYRDRVVQQITFSIVTLIYYFKFLLFGIDDFQQYLIYRISVLTVGNKIVPHFVQAVHNYPLFQNIKCYLIIHITHIATSFDFLP